MDISAPTVAAAPDGSKLHIAEPSQPVKTLCGQIFPLAEFSYAVRDLDGTQHHSCEGCIAVLAAKLTSEPLPQVLVTGDLPRGTWVRAAVGGDFVEGILTGYSGSLLTVLSPTRRSEPPLTTLHYAHAVESIPYRDLSADQALAVELWRDGYRVGNVAALALGEVPSKGKE